MHNLNCEIMKVIRTDSDKNVKGENTESPLTAIVDLSPLA